MPEKKYSNVLISFVLVAAWVLLVVFFLYGKTNKLGSTFGVGVIYILTRHVTIIAGAAAILLRIFRLIKGNTHVLYIFLGVINSCVGLLGIIMYSLHNADLPWLNKCLLSLLVGILMIADTFFLGSKNCSGNQANDTETDLD